MIPVGGGPSPAAETARRNSEKAQIQDIKERFSNYIWNVRSMRNQLKLADGWSESRRHQEEMAALRSTYEEEIGSLRAQLEQSNRERSGGYSYGHRGSMLASEYQSRLWEMNSDILKKEDDIRALQLLIAQQESDIQALKGAAISPSIQLELARTEVRDLQRNIHMAQAKYEEEFSQRLKLQDELSELTLRIEDQKQKHTKESQELRERLAQSEDLVLQLEDQLRSLSRGGPTLMETVQRIQEASEAEVKRLQSETETVYNQSLLELQMRLNNDQILLGQAQEENQHLHQRVEELTSEVTSLENKLLSKDTEHRTLLDKLEAEHVRGLHHIRALEGRLEEMQDLLLAKLQELSSFQETNVSLRDELDALKTMLEEEEQQMGTHQLNFPQTPSSSVHPLADSFQFTMPDLYAGYTGAPQDLTMAAGPEEADSSERETNGDKHQPSDWLKRPASAPPVRLHHPDCNDMKPSSGSLAESGEVSSTPSPPGGDMRRGASRSLESQGSDDDIRRDVTKSQRDRDIKSAVSNAVGNLEISDVHPGGHYVRIVNHSHHKEEDIGGYLLQQNVGGHPVSVYRFPPKSRVMASDAVTVWASGSGEAHNPPTHFLWKQQRNFMTEPRCTTILCDRDGRAVAWFTPLRDKRRKSMEKSEPGPKILPPEPGPKILPPEPETKLLPPEPGPKILPPEPGPKILPHGPGPKILPPEPGHTDEETANGLKSQWPKSPADCRRADTGPRLLKREKNSPPMLSSSPWTQSTASPTHPDFRPCLPPGQDENHWCRQWRSQTAPPSDAPGPWTRNGKNPSVSPGGKRSRGPTRSAGPNSRGVLYLGYSAPAGSVLQKYFSNSSYNIRLASQVSLAPTTLTSV